MNINAVAATSEECQQAGSAAYAAGQPFEAPDYRRESERAMWRIGWKLAAARAGDWEAWRRASAVSERPDKPADVLAYLKPTCPQCGQAGKTQYAQRS